MQTPVILAVVLVLLSGTFADYAEAQVGVDANLADYERVSGVSGNLSSTGSDTLANLMTLWTEAFKQAYPSVNVQVQAAAHRLHRLR